MNPDKTPSRHSLASFIMLLAIVNLLILDLFIVKNFLATEKKTSNAGAVSTTSMTTPTPTASEKTDFQTNISPSPIPTTILQSHSTIIIQNQNTVKEFFVPLGSGASTATDWTDVPGVKADVNSNSYGSIKSILFETSVRVPNANQIVEVRLFNETDGYVVGNSELLYPSGTTDYFRVTAIQLGSSSKTYKVQMKTQLGYSAVLDQARIHITTN